MNVEVSCKDKWPLITIGITCFNAEDTIARAINSALSQDWPNIEVIIVNDCSQDNSEKILSDFSGEYDFIKVIKHEANRGCAASRNKIIQESKGEFLAFFDDDDLSEKKRLSIQYNQILQHESVSKNNLIACFASGIRYYPNGYIMPFQAIGSREIIPNNIMVIDYLLMFEKEKGVFYGGGTPANSMMARIDVYKKVGKFDIQLKRQEDADFAIRLAFIGGAFIGNSEELIKQYATFGKDKSALIEYESSVILYKKHKKYLDQRGLYKYMLIWAKLKYSYHERKMFSVIILMIYLAIRYPIKFFSHSLDSGVKRLIHDAKIKKRFK